MGTVTRGTERFRSVLFERPDGRTDAESPPEPACFADLHLDQVLESMTAGREEYELGPLFYAPLPNVDAVRYRQEIVRDLEDGSLVEAISSFAESMRTRREQLARAAKLYHAYQKKRLFLDAAQTYCDAVRALSDDLTGLDVRSRGLQGLRRFLTDYVESDAFTSLSVDTEELVGSLSEVSYCVLIHGNRVTVRPFAGEPDYSADVEETFAKFKQGAVKSYLVQLPSFLAMNPVEERVLDLVAGLYPDVFRSLDEFCTRHRNYLHRTIGTFDREVQLYLAYLEYMRRFTPTGLRFCYPEVTAGSDQIDAHDAFDLALADTLVSERTTVVCNDFAIGGRERILVVTGPNQGGKTTFARMIGQLHYLASLGLPVPGTSARLSLPDQVFTHFEKEEDLGTLRGKLEDELFRIHDILQRATSSSVVIMNESFTSTTLSDARRLGKAVMSRIMSLDALCVYVTFVEELTSLGEATVSFVSTIDPEDPTVRTYKIVRRPADGLAYAVAIARKYGLTYQSLRRRVAR